ncbi:MAG: cytochrome c maturation protein CcmE [Persicimonas sp.]
MDIDDTDRYDEPFDEFDDLEGTPSEGGNNWALVLGLIVAVALVGYVVTDGLEAETYFYTVDEAAAQGEDLVGQTVRLKGQVEPGTIEGNDGELGRTFNLREKGKSIAVTYNRALPDTFEEDVEVVAQGTVDDSYTLVADEVMVKCPSRYEGEHPSPMEGQGADSQGEGPRAQR